MKPQINRRTVLSSGFLGAATTFGYGSLVERCLLSVEHVPCQVLDSGFNHLKGFKIALLADFHFDDFGVPDLVETAVNRINKESVDIAILAGDFISEDPSVMGQLAEILGEMKTSQGCFSVYGNHDRWHGSEAISQPLERVGISHLVNDSVRLPQVTVCGLDSIWGGKPSIKNTLAEADKNTPIVVAWHEPDTFDLYQDPRVVLQMSGHTHGGQICAPFKGELILPKWGRKYPRGIFRKNNSFLYVNRGIGVTGLPTRFLSRPELTIIEMV